MQRDVRTLCSPLNSHQKERMKLFVLGLLTLGVAARPTEHGGNVRFNYTGYRVLAVTVTRTELVTLQKDTGEPEKKRWIQLAPTHI